MGHVTRLADGFLPEYNYHEWSKFMVKKPEETPTGRHYAVVLFERRTEYTPAYDANDHASSYEVPDIEYFAFHDKATLQAFLLRVTRANKKFFFFEVKKLGEVSLQVNVDISTDL